MPTCPYSVPLASGLLQVARRTIQSVTRLDCPRRRTALSFLWLRPPISTKQAPILAIVPVFFALLILAGCAGVSGTPGNPKTGPQSGGDTPAITLSATSLSFGPVVIGNTDSQTVTITNTGTAALTISQATVSGQEFKLSGISLPLTLAIGQQAAAKIDFSPTSLASASGSVSIASDAPATPVTVSLSGTGVAATHVLDANTSTLNFGTVTDGTSVSHSITLTNKGNSNIQITGVATTGTGFNVSGLAAGTTMTPNQVATLTVSFDPKAVGTATGNILVSSDATNSPVSVALSGTGTKIQSEGDTPVITLSASSLSFGSVAVGNSGSQSVTVSNSGSAGLTISQATVSGQGFSLSGISLPLTLGIGQQATVTVKFSPTAVAADSGSISIASNAPTTPVTVSLSGAGVAATHLLNANTSSISFGNVTEGTTLSQSISLTNNGNSNVQITGVTTTGTGFTTSGVSAGTTLTPSQAVTLRVTFDPLAVGAVTGRIVVASNAIDSPAIALSGMGIASALVVLTWNPSTSSGVTGYNIYRGTSPGTYSRIVSLFAGTNYKDTSVEAGQDLTYYYVVTAVNSSGEESTDSNSASVKVP